MTTVFGVPAGRLATVLVVLLMLAAGALTILAARNVVFLKMGLRNIARRRGRSVLIVVGLMLGTTIIASALLTGDTMGATTRAAVLERLGHTDIAVTASTSDADVSGVVGVTARRPYFPAERAVAAVERAVDGSPLVDGVLPAIVEDVAVQDLTSRRNEPRVTMFAGDPQRLDGFGLDGLAGLGMSDVVLDEDAADELAASVGDEVALLAGGRRVTLRVSAVASYHGLGSDGASAVVAMDTARSLLGKPGQVNHVLVSNTGGETSGARHTAAVTRLVEGALAPLALGVEQVKQDGLELADEQGAAFMSLFTTFGSFSIAAGILLVFLIFVMLAAERRSEMGMARAVGTRRGHLVQMFLYEGVAYDVVAAAVGAALGVAVSYVMVRATSSAFSSSFEGFELNFTPAPRSLVIGYALGVLLTLVVVTVSAWRVSRLDIVAAIRDITTSGGRSRRRRRRQLVGFAASTAVGLPLAVSGASGNVYLPWMLGVSLLVIGASVLVRLLGGPERAAYTVAGLLLVVWWLLPLNFFDGVLGEMKMDFSIWIAGGLILVVAATWLVTYNADLLLGLVSRLFSRFASLAPVVKLAVTYPLRSWFRTAVTLAMFTLVVFTLVTGTTISTAFIRAFDDEARFGGGFAVRATTPPASAVTDLRPLLPADMARDVTASAAQSYLPVQARQDGASDYMSYAVRGVDEDFARATTYQLSARARGYDSPADVWRAVGERPGLAVVDAFVAPRRQNWGAGVLPDFQLTGFYVEDQTFEPVPVTVRDPLTGQLVRLTVIGVLTDSAPFEMSGITVSQRTLTPFGDRVLPTVHHLALRQGVDASAFASRLESSLLSSGIEAEAYGDLLDDVVGGSLMFNRLVLAFMGLGLLVGVAALGVISARSVVERRQHIGVLRAIGFQPAMIRRALLLESSFVSLTSIALGTGLGLAISYNVIADSARQPNYADVSLAVPWPTLAAVFTVVYLAALGTTLLPAIRASRIYPAEALRYQ